MSKKKIVDIETYMPVLRELLQQGQEVSVVITGNSMYPFLVNGRDEILISPPNGEWKKGDMAFFQRENGQYVMHRICRVRADGSYGLVGDRQTFIEEPIFRDQMFGKITAVKRNGKWIGPENFWWNFYAYVWIRMISVRPMIFRLFAALKKLCR